MRRALSIALIFSATLSCAQADSPTPGNRPHTAKSANEKFTATFTPSNSYGEEGTGRSVEVATGKELYSFHWFANDVELSNDGRGIVRHGPWASDQQKHTDLAIAFYRDGKLLKSYKVYELVRDPHSVDESVSHYMWKAEKSETKPGFSEDNTRYAVVTTDKNVYEFDVATGMIATIRKDPTARSRHEIWQAEESEAEKNALAIVERTSALKAFSSLFNFTRANAKLGVMSGVTLDAGPQWFADLHPLNPQLARNMAEVVFRIDPQSDQAEVGIDPVGLEQRLRDIGTVPFVQKLLDAHPDNDYRIRAAGNHYYWDADQLKRIIDSFPPGISPPSADKWFYFIVDYKPKVPNPKHPYVTYLSFYHPMDSNLFVLTGNFEVMPTLTEPDLAQLKPVPDYKGDQMALLDSNGALQSVLHVPFAP